MNHKREKKTKLEREFSFFHRFIYKRVEEKKNAGCERN